MLVSQMRWGSVGKVRVPDRENRDCRLLMLCFTQMRMSPTTMKTISNVFTHLGVTVFMSLLLGYL